MQDEATVAPPITVLDESPLTMDDTSTTATVESPPTCTTVEELAQAILGTSQESEPDISHAMEVYLKMKEELEQLQRESKLTQQALLATQCSQTIVAMRLEDIESDNSAFVMDEEEEDEEEEDEDEEMEDDLLSKDAVSIADPDTSLDEEIRRILPSRSQSLGVGLLGDMEECILEWQSAFELLNQQHERQVQACQADIEQLHLRLDSMTALHPNTHSTSQAAQQAQQRLVELVQTVEAFPSKARLEALQHELEISRQTEMQALEDYAQAVEELEAARRREEDLLERLERVRSGLPLLPRRKTPTIKLSLFTKRKLQRLFKLDQSVRKQQEQPQEAEAASIPDCHDISTPQSNDSEKCMDLFQVGSKEDEPLFVFDHEEEEDWSVGDQHDHGPSTLLAVSPSKLSQHSSDDTFYSENTDGMTHSTSGSPTHQKSSKIGAGSALNDDDDCSKASLWQKTKTLLWLY